MKDYIFADAVANTLRADEQGEFYVLPTTTPEEALQYGTSCEPYAFVCLVAGGKRLSALCAGGTAEDPRRREEGQSRLQDRSCRGRKLGEKSSRGGATGEKSREDRPIHIRLYQCQLPCGADGYTVKTE